MPAYFWLVDGTLRFLDKTNSEIWENRGLSIIIQILMKSDYTDVIPDGEPFIEDEIES